MKKAEYLEYLKRFNTRDYPGVLEFWAPQFNASFAGVALRDGKDLMKFYEFFHSYVTETISVLDFVADEALVALRAEVRIEGRRELTQDALKAAGYGGLIPVAPGQVVLLPQLIMYQLEAGKFKTVFCGMV